MCNFRDQGDDLSCLVQIGVAQVPEFAAMGFRSIVCNRPDDAVLAASRAGGCELDELRPLLTSARDAS